MSLLRTTTSIRTALRPSARALLLLPRNTRPFLTTSLRQADSSGEDWYEPNDGGKYKQKDPSNKDTSSGRFGRRVKLDGTSELTSNKPLIIIAGVTAVLAVAYFYMTGKPDTIVATDLKNDPEAIRRHSGSDRQRKGGPERSEK